LPRLKFFNTPWYRAFLNYDVQSWLTKITVPVLAIGGDLDWITSPAMAFQILSSRLKAAGNQHFELLTLPNLNHSLQTCKTGAFKEYGELQEAIAPVALEKLANWLQQQKMA
jgi:fermentation-respiration switch protein FrsA (DUF1100 family)